MSKRNLAIGTLGALLAIGIIFLTAFKPEARAADAKAKEGPFLVELVDGSMLKGKAVFEIDLVTRYGKLSIPSAAVSAVTWNRDEGTITVETDDLTAKGKASFADLRLETIAGAVVVPSRKISRVSRSYVSPVLGEGWTSLLSGKHLKSWGGPVLPPKNGVLRMTTQVNVYGAVYTGKVPERCELVMEVKFTPGARTDVHVADKDGTSYVRVSDVARDKANQWISVRFVRDDDVKAYVDGKQVGLHFWGHQGSPVIALSSDFAEAEFRNIAVRARE